MEEIKNCDSYPATQREAEVEIPKPKKRKKNPNGLRWTYRVRREWSPDIYRQVFNLAKAQATVDECAAYLGWTPAGLERQLRRHGWDSFAEFQREAISRSKAELKRTLLALALGGKHPSATVFYAKSILGMSEKQLDAMGRDEIEELTAAEVEARLVMLDGQPLDKPDDAVPKPPSRKKPALPLPENYETR